MARICYFSLDKPNSGQGNLEDHERTGTCGILSANVSDIIATRTRTQGFRLMIAPTILAFGIAASASRADTVDNYIRAQMRRRGIPGVSIAVVDGGKLVRSEGFGVIAIGSRIRVTPKTLFQAASISKLVTAVGAMKLVQDGVLSLDDDANTQLKSWKVPENAFTKDQKVTLRRLLSHTAGVSPADFNGYWPDAQTPTLKQILDGKRPANSQPVRVDEVPGSEGRYSGGGYVIVRQLMEDETGTPFSAWMKNRILDPLGMEDSLFAQPLPSSLENRAAMGNIVGSPSRKGKWRIFPELAPDGLWSTPTDLARFIIGIQRSIILNGATTAQMLTVVQDNSGLGPGIRGQGEMLRFLHAGSQWGFTSLLMAYAHKGQGAVIMMNSNDSFDVVPRMMQVIGEAYQWPGYRRLSEIKRPPTKDISAKKLNEYRGRFEFSDESMMTLDISGKSLVARRGSEYIDQFSYAGKDTFVAQDLPDEFVFRRNDQGEITGVNEIELGLKGPVVSSNVSFPKIGPLARLMARKSGTSPLDNRIESILASLQAGGAAIQSEKAMTVELRKDLGSGPVPEVAGLKSVSFLGAEHVSRRGIRRHGNDVGTVLYYRLVTDDLKGFLLIYLTPKGLVADFDRVEE